jgi:hypothetical protein
MKWRSPVVASILGSIFFSCGDSAVSTDDALTEEKGGLQCRIARKDSGKVNDCRCVEIGQHGDTLSIGSFHIDALGQPLFRRGWHTVFSDSGITRIHYTGIQYHADSSFDENVDQIIHINRSGDTLLDRSCFVKTRALDSVRLNAQFDFQFQYFPLEEIDSIDVATLVTRPGDDNNVNFAPRRRYSFQRSGWYGTTVIPTDTGHFVLQAVLYGNHYYSNDDSMSVITCYFDHPFVVLP